MERRITSRDIQAIYDGQQEAPPTVGELIESLHFAGFQAVAIAERDDVHEDVWLVREDRNGADRHGALAEAGGAVWGYSGPRRESTP